MHRDLKEVGRSHETIREQCSIPGRGNGSAQALKWVSAWSAGGFCSSTEGGLRKSSRGGQEGPEGHITWAQQDAGCWLLTLREMGSHWRILNRGVKDLTYFYQDHSGCSIKTVWGERVAVGRPLRKLSQ